MKKNRILLYVTSLLSFAGTLILYPGLPDRIPTHFDYQWEIDGYGPKYVALLLALLPLAMCLLMDVLPKIDPKSNLHNLSNQAYEVFRMLLVILMLVLNWATIFLAKEVNFNAKVVMTTFMGVIFIGVGNYMPKVKPNYFIGVKTPWTLANDVVWRKTHRVSGYIFMVFGIMMLMSAVIPGNWFGLFMMIALFIGVAFMFLYSYLIYQKEMQKEKKEK